MNKITKKKGFTLIELIVVIAILGILTTIATPRLSGYLSTAKSSADTVTAKTIQTAALAAYSDGELALANAGPWTILINSATSVTATNVTAVSGTVVSVLQNYIGDSLPIPQDKVHPKFLITFDASGEATVTKP